jgi:hypothetical protein
MVDGNVVGDKVDQQAHVSRVQAFPQVGEGFVAPELRVDFVGSLIAILVSIVKQLQCFRAYLRKAGIRDRHAGIRSRKASC